MTERVEQWICIKFCIKLQLSSMETIQMIQKATAMGNWWLAASPWQCARSCIMSHAEFLVKQHITQVTQPLSQPRFGALRLLAFPQNKNHTWNGRDFRLSVRFRKIQKGSWWPLGELCEVPRCLLWRGLRCHCLCTMFLVFCIFFNKCLYVSYLDTFWTDPVYHLYLSIKLKIILSGKF